MKNSPLILWNYPLINRFQINLNDKEQSVEFSLVGRLYDQSTLNLTKNVLAVDMF